MHLVEALADQEAMSRKSQKTELIASIQKMLIKRNASRAGALLTRFANYLARAAFEVDFGEDAKEGLYKVER
jgi:hypothetical protein